MRCRHWVLVVCSSVIWLGMGLFLLNKGVGFVIESVEVVARGHASGHPLVHWLAQILGSAASGAIVLFGIALVAGPFTGRTVMAKAVGTIVGRIATLPELSPLWKVYGRRSYILILSMMALGLCLRLLGIPEEIRGTVLVAVGTALIHGGIQTLRMAIDLRQAARAS
jgi:hypothetical protein